MEARQCERRVVEWARWANMGNGRQQRCGSAERAFVPPRVDELDELRKGSEPVDVVAAEQVEQVIRRRLRVVHRHVLTLLYVQRESKGMAGRRLAMTVDDIERLRSRALEEVGKELDRDDGVVLIRRGKPLWAGTCR